MTSPQNTSEAAQGQVRILASWIGPAGARQDEYGDLQTRWTELREREQRQRLAELELERKSESVEEQRRQLQAAGRGQLRSEQQESQTESAKREALDRQTTTNTETGFGGGEAEQGSSEGDDLRAEVRSLRRELEDSKSKNEALLMRNAVIIEEIRSLRESRRLLFHQYSSYRTNMEVMVRVRPVRDGEGALPAIAVKQSQPGRLTLSCPGSPLDVVTAEADRIFDQATTNQEIYLEIVRHPWSLLDGRNVCIAAYGQTGSGKTYMMSYVSREVVAELFRHVLTEPSGCTYTLKARCVEVYLDNIYDLLSGEGDDKKTKLRVREDEKQSQVTVEGCTQRPVESEKDWDSLLKQVERCRTTGMIIPKGHSLAHQSSRSNLVLTIIMEGYRDGKPSSRAQLDLVDLAGSEGVPESARDDTTLKKETAAINQSLLALGRVISALGGRNSHVPYQDAVLTRLLKYSLGFGARSLFLVTASPLARDFLQTKSSLAFSTDVLRARVGSRAKAKDAGAQKRP